MHRVQAVSLPHPDAPKPQRTKAPTAIHRPENIALRYLCLLAKHISISIELLTSAELGLACDTIISAAAGGGLCGEGRDSNPCAFALLAMAVCFWGGRGRCVAGFRPRVGAAF